MDVGAELKRARTALGLTPAQLAERTNIRAAVISAIESNEFAACGGDVFARGHVRTICTALDLDPAPLLASMGAVLTPTTLEAPEPETLDIWELRARSHLPSEARSWGLVAMVAVVIVLAILWWQRAHQAAPVIDPSSLPSVTSSATATVTPEPTPTADDSSAPSSTASASATATASQQGSDSTVVSGAVVLRLDCADTSWVRITNAAGTLFQGTLHAGDARGFESDTDVSVRIGNAAGVSLTVNDISYGVLGAPGAVYSHTFLVG